MLLYKMPPKRKPKLKRVSTDIINFYENKKVQKLVTKSINPHYDKHRIKVPFRGIMIGSSGSGKTNLLLNIIVQMADTFNHIYIYTQAQETLYNYLESQIDSDLLTIRYGLKHLREFKEENYYGSSLIIFDDLCLEKDQSCISELYIRGRKIAGGCSLLYLTQSYYKVPKTIRLQSSYIFIIKVSGMRDLNLIMSEYSLGASKIQLQNMYKYCCVNSGFGNFLLIDLEVVQDKTYRKNFIEYLNPDDFN